MPTTAELLAALPADDQETSETQSIQDPAALEKIFQTLGDRPVPTGTLRRLFSIGGLSATLSMAYFAYWIRSWYKPVKARETDLFETNLRAALKTFETMGYMRGAVAKLGQFLTCFPESLPEGFVDTLKSLHFQAPPMHYALIREQLLSEIGDPDEVFAEFDESAVAAASIGQVHRARLKTGEEVAVKIQYPGIARTIRSDLRSLKAAMRPMLFNRDWKAVEAIFDELRTGLERETDYENEALNLADARRLVADDDIVVPRVYEQFSTRRVLTMEFLDGLSFEEYLASEPSQEQRDHYGVQISRALYRTFKHRMLYTDAHPGNFLFMEEGRLGFIDFGNVRRFNEEEWEFHMDIAAAREAGHDEHVRVCKRSLMMTDGDARKHSEMVDLVVEGFGIYNEPLVFEGAFDYGDPDYMRRLLEWISRTSKQKWVKQLPMNAFSHRLNFQIPALLFELKSRVNVRELVREEGGDLTSESP